MSRFAPELYGVETEVKYGGGLDSTPESNPIPQTGKGATSMKSTLVRLPRLLYRVSIEIGSVLARMYRLCHRIEFSGIGVSLIPGLLACNISFRAGESGRAHHSYRHFVQHGARYVRFCLP